MRRAANCSAGGTPDADEGPHRYRHQDRGSRLLDGDKIPAVPPTWPTADWDEKWRQSDLSARETASPPEWPSSPQTHIPAPNNPSETATRPQSRETWEALGGQVARQQGPENVRRDPICEIHRIRYSGIGSCSVPTQFPMHRPKKTRPANATPGGRDSRQAGRPDPEPAMAEAPGAR